nr:D-galactarate dehydratase [Klebsiella pneumoniae]
MVDVLRYGERLKVHGLNLLSAPGNDAVATSALAGAGCHMVLFSTGRGTPYGGFVPTVKIATNSELAAKKSTGSTLMPDSCSTAKRCRSCWKSLWMPL